MCCHLDDKKINWKDRELRADCEKQIYAFWRPNVYDNTSFCFSISLLQYYTVNTHDPNRGSLPGGFYGMAYQV